MFFSLITILASVSHLLYESYNISTVDPILQKTEILLLNAPMYDITGNFYSESARLTTLDSDSINLVSQFISLANNYGLWIIYDSTYRSFDEEYLDTKLFNEI